MSLWQWMDHGICNQISKHEFKFWERMDDRQTLGRWQTNNFKCWIWCGHGTWNARSRQIPNVGISAEICHLQKQKHVIQSQFNICRSFAPRHANEPRCVSASKKTLFSNGCSHGNYCTQNSKASSQTQHSTGYWFNTIRQHNIPAATSTKDNLRVSDRHIDVGINV